MAQHTPGPMSREFIDDTREELISEREVLHAQLEEAEALNAVLLAALEGALDWCRGWQVSRTGRPTKDDIAKLGNELHAAIAKAKGGAS